jgi:hypothetical protein
MQSVVTCQRTVPAQGHFRQDWYFLYTPSLLLSKGLSYMGLGTLVGASNTGKG